MHTRNEMIEVQVNVPCDCSRSFLFCDRRLKLTVELSIDAHVHLQLDNY